MDYCCNLSGQDAVLREPTFLAMGSDIISTRPGPRLNIKTVFPGYEDSHVKGKMVVRPFYL